MTDRAAGALAAEARAFAAALPAAANDYVAARYADAHRHLALDPATPFDAVLLDFAAGGPLFVRAADAYARLFAPRSALRRKLTVLVAILESASPSDAAFADSVRHPAAVVVELLVTGAGFALLLAAGTAALAPAQLAGRLGRGRA